MGVDHKGSRIPLRVFVLFLACIEYEFQLSVGCKEQEREALLTFKRGLIDDSGLLSSWGSHDECCEWDGVECSNTTGHVTVLQLNPFSLFKDNLISSTSIYPLRGKIDSALLQLHHLNTLNLRENNFEGIKIPEFIGSIKTLQHLDLSHSNYSGSIPFHLGNLTNLRTLDLSYNSHLQSHNLYWLSRLSLLSYLDLSYTKISDANWVLHVLMPPSLQQLYLRRCMLPDVTKSLFVYNSSSSAKFLSILDLSYNDLTSFTFHWLFNASLSFVTFDFLERLDLSNNKIQGGIPKSLRNLTHLQDLNLSYNGLGEALEELLGKLPRTRMVSLDLSNNQLTGSVPTFLGQFSKLQSLDLSSNSLEGIVSETHFIGLHNLVSLRLSFNSLTLDFSPGWIPPFHLQDIGLASCKMGPSFPTWLQTQRNVELLDLSNSFISDEVPKWFWNLSSTMFSLNLSHNQMSGIIPDLSSIPLVEIDLSFNMFSGPMPQLPSRTSNVQLNQNKFSGPIPQLPSEIFVVQLSQNKFSGSISFICKLSLNNELIFIDLSNNQFEGSLPNCLENMTNLRVLNLNNNNFSGEIPHSLGDLLNLETLHLRGNNLSGELPSTLKNCRNLQLIDIGDNKISGNIPPWMGENYRYLTHLSLRRNSFHGAIPSEICHLNQMQMLDLSGNDLSGKIPQCFNNFTSLVNKNTTTTSSIVILLPGGGYIEYALVQWKGQDSEYKNTLGLLKLIDLSSNKLVGSIPKAFSSLRDLICLNLSRNSLTGNIDPNIGEMEMLDCLDLSRNHLTGEIPSSLANLHYLGVLDLAYNNLLGKIPTSTQLQSFNESVFAGNYDLCGKPLELCPEDAPRPSTTNEGEKKDEGIWSLSFMQEFGIAMGFGFIIGFWGLVGSLVLKSSWRWSYFHFLDVVGVWLYETSTVCFTKLRRRS